jgi:hypothetical protein
MAYPYAIYDAILDNSDRKKNILFGAFFAVCYGFLNINVVIPDMPKPPVIGLTPPPTGSWVQVERRAMEKWAHFSIENPRASSLMLMLTAQMGDNNAVVASQATLAEMTGCSLRTVQRSIYALKNARWIDIVQIGPTGTTCAYVVNDEVAWYGDRAGKRFSLFSASVIASEAEQPTQDTLGQKGPLERLPRLYPGERQLPTGPGLDPPSEPALPSMEQDLPARRTPHER